MGGVRKGKGLWNGDFIYFTWFLRLAAVVTISVLLVSCGSGGGGTGGSSGPTPNFSLSLTPSNLSIQDGTSAQASLEADGSNGFSSRINVGVSGLPAGITVSPPAITLTPGTPQQVTFSAGPSAAVSNATVTFTATSGSLAHTAKVALDVINAVTSNTPPFRMRYVRTDASTAYFLWPNSSWIIYNPPTNRFFVTDPSTNRIYALDAKTETVVGSIVVPGAYGIDDTPDHSTLYVGTQIGDVYAVNPVTMTVTHRYLASQIGPNGFHAASVQVMADGRLALLGSQGGIASVDGYGSLAFWNPADNAFSTYTPQQACGPLESIGKFARSPDRTKIFIASADTDDTLCEIDESTGSAIYSQPAGGIDVFNFAQSPDGNLIAFPYAPNGTDEAVVLDAHTLAQVNLFSVKGDTSSADDFIIGPNSQTLYTSSDSTVYAYNLTTGQQVGWLPNIFVPPYGAGYAVSPINSPDFQAMDGTGLIAGPMEEGVGFLDTSNMQTGPVGTQFTNSYLGPATGPVNGGMSTTWPVSSTETMDYPSAGHVNIGNAPLGTITGVYFGSQEGLSPSASMTSGTISAITPPGAPGPASVYALDSDGGVDYVPEGFSYGPTILEVTPNEATAGGGTGFIYGYGFGPLLQTSSTSVPSGLVVTVGGQTAKVTGFNANAYGLLSPPFALQALTYTIPPGTAGTSVDVSVTSSSGTATAHDAMTYLPAIQEYSLSGSSLAEGVYDPETDLYYFTDATEIRVFSKTNGQWLPPITLPAADNPQRLWGIAISPDDSKLAVADIQGQAIYVISTANPSSVQKFPVPQLASGVITNPVGVAITDSGIVYFTALTVGGTGYDVFFKLDTGSGQVTDYNNIGSNSPLSDNYLRTILNAGDNVVYGNDDGEVFSVNTTTDTVTYEPTEPGCCYGDYDMALSGDKTRLAATGYLYDANLNAESYDALNLREQANISYLYGEKLSPDGHLLFQPTNVGIDVLDGRLGTLLDRIALPVALSPNYDALVSDGTDNSLVAITGANSDGIAVVNLTSIPDPAPLPYNTTAPAAALLSAQKTARPPRDRNGTKAKSSVHGRPEQLRPKIPHVTVQNLLLRARLKTVAPR